MKYQIVNDFLWFITDEFVQAQQSDPDRSILLKNSTEKH